MNDMQEAAASAARTGRAQDKKIPFLINIGDGRLIPNTKMTRKNVNYRPYRGNVNATKEERMRYLATNGLGGEVPEAAEEAPFDIGKASKDELIAFALMEFGENLQPGMHLATMRSRVHQMAKAAKGDAELG